jgi:hypothetical protein
MTLEINNFKDQNFKLNQELESKNTSLVNFSHLKTENLTLKNNIECLQSYISQFEAIIEQKKDLETQLQQSRVKINDLEEQHSKICTDFNTNSDRLKSIAEEYQKLHQKHEETCKAHEISNKKIAQQVKTHLKKKYRLKEENLKKEINISIEEIQESIKQNNVDFKKENLELISQLRNLENLLKEKENTLDSNRQTIEEIQKSADLLRQKAEIAENALKSEIENTKNLSENFEQEKNYLKALNSSLNKKLDEKSNKIILLSKEISDQEAKNKLDCLSHLEKEKKMYQQLDKFQENNLVETDKLKSIIHELTNHLKSTQKDLNDLKEDYECKSAELEKNKFEKLALEKSISNLELSLKQLDIQQARQGLEELNTLKIKINKENQIKSQKNLKISELSKEMAKLNDLRKKDSQFFKIEASRKDQEFLKLKSYYESKLKQKEADFALKIEELKTELFEVLTQLTNLRVSPESCQILEEIIKSL